MAVPSVAVVAFDGISPFHLAVPSLVLGPETPRSESEPWLLTVCAPQAGPLRTSGGFDVLIEHDLDAIDTADVVIVPWWGDPETAAPGPVVDAVRLAHDRGATIVGLCLGVFVLADAGVLDGRRATTHWKWTDVFRRRFPAVDLDPSALYVDEGPVLTGAGASAGIDTCLHLLANHAGQSVANRVARRVVAAPHRPGGQAQFIERPVLTDADDDPIGQASAWAAAHLDGELSIDRLATAARMSRSSFTRAFRARTGSTVLTWVTRLRVDHARELLEATSCPVETIAAASGFGSAAVLRDHFQRELGTTPSQYREAFRRRG